MTTQDEMPPERPGTPGSNILLQLILGFFLIFAFCGLAWLKFGAR